MMESLMINYCNNCKFARKYVARKMTQLWQKKLRSLLGNCTLYVMAGGLPHMIVSRGRPTSRWCGLCAVLTLLGLSTYSPFLAPVFINHESW